MKLHLLYKYIFLCLSFQLIIHEHAQAKNTSFDKLKTAEVVENDFAQIRFAGFGFEENLGQVVDQFGAKRDDVLFSGKKDNLKIILTANSISYQFEKQISKNPEIFDKKQLFNKNNAIQFDSRIIAQRVDIEFLGSNDNVPILRRGKSNDFVNYIRAAATEPKIYTCYSFDTIIYKNVYNNIDIVFYNANRRSANENLQNDEIVFKYDFIVRKGGKVSDIKLKYKGCNELSVVEDKLRINAGFVDFCEYIPVSYAISENEAMDEINFNVVDNGKIVKVEYVLEDDVLSFRSDVNDFDATLVIDPYFIYSTYYGGSLEDVGMEVACDRAGYYYVVGYTTSNQNIATTGAEQTELAGEKDAFLVKFSGSGERQWGTYFGGNNYDFGHALACDHLNNVYIAGWTQTRTGMATAGAFQVSYGGGEFDSFLAKFNSSGQLIWSTYFGGEFEDYINDIVVDGSGDVVFIGRTSSPSRIASGLAFQSEFGGNFDAFLQKFNAGGNRIWGTYYGGGGFDVGMELCTDIFNNIAITGYTQSKTGMVSDNAFKDSLSGIWDAFIAKFDRNGIRQWGTYFGGEDDDNGWGIGSDAKGNIYVTGNTNSYNNISTAGVHKEELEGTELDAFVVKFGKLGSRIWGTYYGGDEEEYGNAGAIDPWCRFIISGTTLSDTGISTSDAPQKTRSSQRDAFVASFDSSGQRVFGTYFGAGQHEYGHGVTVDNEGRILLTGYSFSSNLLTTVNAHQPNYGGNADAFLVKIGDVIPSDSISTYEFSDTLCADDLIFIPYEVSNTFSSGNVFTAQLSNMTGGFEEFFDIGSLATNVSGTITGKIPKECLTGSKYRIRVIGSSPQVIGTDNALDITIYELPNPEITGSKIVCKNKSYIYKGIKSAVMNYKWLVSGGSIVGDYDDKDEIEAVWSTVGIGYVKLVITNSITDCNDSSEVEISIEPEVLASSIFGPDNLCPKQDVEYYCLREERLSNKWEVEGGVIVGDSTGDTVVVNWNEVNKGTLRLIQVSTFSGCLDTNELAINLYELPKPIIIGDILVKANSSSIYRTTASSKYNFLWSVEGGEIEGSAKNNVVYVNWLGQGYGSICLLQRDKDTGCEDSLKLNILIIESATEIISGDTVVCSFSEHTYEVIDTNYTYNWLLEGGELLNDSSGMKINVLWGSPGMGFVFLYRVHKTDGRRDTLILDIEILESPKFIISGRDDFCEGVRAVFWSDFVLNCVNKWSVVSGSIIGSASSDSVIIYWDRLSDIVEENNWVGVVSLTKTDTQSSCSRTVAMNVNINRTPRVVMLGDSCVCENEYVVYSTDFKVGEVKNWQIGGGIITANSGDTSITVRWGKQVIGFVQVFSSFENGCSDSSMMTVSINKSPDKPIITQSGKVLISSADDGNQWFLSNDKIEGATAQTFSPMQSGFYTVQVRSDNGCLSEMSAPYNFIIDDVSDFNEFDVVLFPNPTRNIINIQINLLNYSNFDIKIFDLLGKLVNNYELRITNYETGIMDLSGLPTGVYFLSIVVDGVVFRYYRVIVY